jgi:hypothetical protein
MTFYCDKQAFETLSKNYPVVDVPGYHIYTWQVLKIINVKEVNLFFMNDGGGIFIVLHFNDEAEMKNLSGIWEDALNQIMKDMEYPEEVIRLYVDMPWRINISKIINYGHMDLMVKTILKYGKELCDNIEPNTTVQRKFSKIINDRFVEYWDDSFKGKKA